MRGTIYRVCILLSILLLFSLLIWIFTLHGTAGIFQVEGIFRLCIIVLAALGIILVGLSFLQLRFERHNQSPVKHWLTIPIVILSAIGIIIPISGFTYLNSRQDLNGEIKTPGILLAEGQNTRGVPVVAIVAYTDKPSTSVLTWGTRNTKSYFYEETSAEQHIFILRNLEPATEYWYQFDNGAVYAFNTPDTHNTDIHFAAGADAHFGASNNHPDLTLKMFGQIANPANDYDYFFSLGDLVNIGFRDSQWLEALQSLSTVSSNIPVVFVPGNHDTLFTGLTRYNYYCNPIETSNQSSPQLWHRYDIGTVHFLCLDLEWSAETYSPVQAYWLEEELKTIPQNDWKIVMSHGYYYASGSVVNGWRWYDNPETINLLTLLFEKYNVDMVFSGHVHQLELLQKSGVTYIISGGLGGMADPLYTYKSPVSQWYAGGQYGFTDVTINGNEANIIFRDPDYKEIKSFILNKN